MNLEALRMDVYKCARCGCCRSKYDQNVRGVCPSYWHSSGFETNYSRGIVLVARGILEGALNYSKSLAEHLATCTTCMNCVQQCGGMNLTTGEPMTNTPRIVEAMRADIMELGLAIEPHTTLASRTEKDHNPYNERHEARLNWAEKLDIPNNVMDTMFFVGCTQSYRRTEAAIATAKILQKLNIPFGILSDEWCCGSPLLRTGSRKLTGELARHNVEALKGAKRVVFSCAGCFRQFKEDYPQFVGELPFETLHISQLLSDLIKEGELKMTEPIAQKVTYHDPCHLGRHLKIYYEPREVLRAIPGIELVEMYPAKENAWCCGGGGGVKVSYPKMAVEIASDKLLHAKEVGATAIVSACPFCKTNILDAVKATNSDLEVYDITELVAKSMGE